MQWCANAFSDAHRVRIVQLTSYVTSVERNGCSRDRREDLIKKIGRERIYWKISMLDVEIMSPSSRLRIKEMLIKLVSGRKSLRFN